MSYKAKFTESITIPVSPDMLKRIKAYSDQIGESMSEAVRRLLQDSLDAELYTDLGR